MNKVKLVLIPIYLFILQISSLQSLLAKDLIQWLHLRGDFIQGGLIRGHSVSGSQIFLDKKKIFITRSGDFAFGFSRDAAKQSELIYIGPDGQKDQQIIHIIQRKYRIQRIDGLAQDKVTPGTAAQKSRIKNDIALVSAARANASDLTGFMQNFIWPAAGKISGVYGSQRILNGQPRRPHFGLDIAAPTGSRVIAPADGQVVLAQPDMYFSGGTIIIDHGGGVFSSFLHLSQLSVKVSQRVKQGETIALVGASGRVTGPHLDWRINWFYIRLDPATLVSAVPPSRIITGQKPNLKGHLKP